MLITETGFAANWFQQIPKDTLKKVKVDTLDDEEALETKVTYTARDSIRYENKGKKLYLYGDGYVEYDNSSMKAEYVIIDNEKNLIKAYGKKDSLGAPVGNPLFKSDGEELVMDTIVYNLKTKKGKMYNVQTKQAGMLIFGREIKKDSNNVVYMRHMRCLPCEFKDGRTVFNAGKAKIIPDDKIVTGPMYLEISGVPTPLALPFGYFPNSKKRHSGLLMPTYGNSDQFGFYLKNAGFYWGISDQTDMTIRSDMYTNGSFGLRTLNNYNVKYKYNGSLALGFSQFKFGEKEIPSSLSKQKSFSVNWVHNQDNKNNPNYRFSSNVNIVTSRYNKFNATNTGQYLANTFQSNINFTRLYKTSSLTINARHNQNTQTRQMQISFPELTYNVNRFFPFKREGATRQNALDKLGISYLLEAKNSLSGYDSSIFKGNIPDSLKYGVRHTVPVSTNMTVFKYFTVTPSLNFSAVMYGKTSYRYLDYATNTLRTGTTNGFKAGYDANFNTSVTTKVFVDYIFRSKRVKQIRHLLIPSISYLYRPDFGQSQYGFWKTVLSDTTGKNKTRYSIFENNLFNGPAIGKQNSLSFNLSNNLEAKIRQKTDSGYVYNKVTILQNVGITGSYNFAADSFNMSNFGLTGRTKIWKFFDLMFDSGFDPYGINSATHTRSREYVLNTSGKLVRFVSGDIALNAAFSSSAIEKMKIKKQPDLTNGAEQGAANTADTKQAKLPWNLNVYYKINFLKSPATATTGQTITKTQALNFSGDVRITKFWKVGMTSGYDFTNKGISYTSVNVYRDLKCWEARIDWVPFGFRKSYSVTINLKSAMLSDIKIPRQKPPGFNDNF